MMVRRRLYIVDRNINYTNVCVYRCQFCAFYRPSSKDPDSYVLSWDQIGEKIRETIDLGGTGVLLQGGVHAELPFSFYEEMFRFIRKNFPTIHLHALSAPEVYFLQKITKWPMRDVIDDHVTGFVFPRADYAALEKVLLRLVEDPALRNKVGARAKQTVFERHTWAANARFIVQLAAGERAAGSFAQMKRLNCDIH